MSKNYKLSCGKYLKIDITSNGYEYSLYTQNKKLIDGGILEQEELIKACILKEVLKILNFPTDTGIQEINEEIEENNNLVFKNTRSRKPMTERELAEEFWYGNKAKMKKYGYDMNRLSGELCDCDGQGRFVLEEPTEYDKKIGQKRYMKCRICGNYSHL